MRSARNKLGFPMISPMIDVFLAVGIIVLSTGTMQYFQAGLRAQDRPILASLASWGKRLATLRAKYERLLRELECLPSPDELQEVDLQALEAARQRLLEELAALGEEIARLQAALQQAQRKHSQVDQEQQRLFEELERLKQQISDLEAQREKLRYDRQQIEELKKKLAELLKQLQDAQQRFCDLQNKIAAERARQVEGGFRVEVHPRVRAPQGLQREIVVIYQTTVTPVCEPYFERIFAVVGTSRVPVDRLKRRGPAAAEALRPGSEFMRWIDKLDPQRQYVFLFVDAASFETFRAVRAQLQKGGVMCGWEPAEDVVALGPGLQGGQNVRTDVQ